MRFLILLFLTILITGCEVLPEPVKSTNSLRLDEVNVKKFQTINKIISIKIIDSIAYANSTKFIYKKDDGIYDKYAYSVWDERLSSMIEKLLISSIKSSNLFKNALSTQSISNYDYILEVSIDKFEHDISCNCVNVWLSLNLIDTKTKISIANQSFKTQKITKSVDANGALTAYNEALEEIINSILEWLSNRSLA